MFSDPISYLEAPELERESPATKESEFADWPCGQVSEVQPGKMGPAPGRFELFKGHFSRIQEMYACKGLEENYSLEVRIIFRHTYIYIYIHIL